MKIFGFSFLVFIFLVNMFTLSAWAKPCLNDGAMDMPAQSQSIMDHGNMDISDMPCENMQQNQVGQDRQHCDGVCLCLHVSVHQSPILNNLPSLSLPALASTKHDFINDRFAGISISTLKRPPRA